MEKKNKTQVIEPKIEQTAINKAHGLLSGGELERIAVRFNSAGQYGTMKMIHKALMHYNKFLKGEITKDEL